MLQNERKQFYEHHSIQYRQTIRILMITHTYTELIKVSQLYFISIFNNAIATLKSGGH